MADVRPFMAIRPSEAYKDVIPALPYDVYNRKEAREQVQKEPHSFLAIDRPETQFPEDMDMYADAVYEKAADMLKEWREEGAFLQEDKPCYYIYELTMNGRTQTGIGAVASIVDYDNQIIKKHENTRADKEEDRVRHVSACGAQTGPVFLAYRNHPVIGAIVAARKTATPVYDFTKEDQVRHRVWILDREEDISRIQQAFAEIQAIYIADGHHRCASAVRVGKQYRENNPRHTGNEEYNYFLSVLFPEDELMIMDYNRVVHDLNGIEVKEFLHQLETYFTVSAISHAEHPRKKGEITMYVDKQWYRLSMKDCLMQSSDPVEQLDVAILQKYVLDNILAIKNPKTDQRISFVGGIRGLKELENMADEYQGVSFAMYPTDIRELFAVADAGKLMPPKSTWFEPKLRSGILIHVIDQ
ncbi:MAG: DUF1015 domain-containing protein [Lachnospiraceae bacterium]